MKILVIGPSPDKSKGGMATVIKEIQTDKELNKKFDIEIYESYIDGKRIKRMCFSLFSLIRFYFLKRHFDLYHVHMASYGSTFRKGIYIYLAKKWNKKVIIHVHGAEYKTFYEKSNKKNRIKKILQSGNLVITLSNHWKSYFDKTFRNK